MVGTRRGCCGVSIPDHLQGGRHVGGQLAGPRVGDVSIPDHLQGGRHPLLSTRFSIYALFRSPTTSKVVATYALSVAPLREDSVSIPDHLQGGRHVRRTLERLQAVAGVSIPDHLQGGRHDVIEATLDGVTDVSIPDHLQGGRHLRRCHPPPATPPGFDPRPPPRWSPPGCRPPGDSAPPVSIPDHLQGGRHSLAATWARWSVRFRSPTTSKVVATAVALRAAVPDAGVSIPDHLQGGRHDDGGLLPVGRRRVFRSPTTSKVVATGSRAGRVAGRLVVSIPDHLQGGRHAFGIAMMRDKVEFRSPTTSKVVATWVRSPMTRRSGSCFDPRPPPRWSPPAVSPSGGRFACVSIPDHLQGGRHPEGLLQVHARGPRFDPRPPPRWSPRVISAINLSPESMFRSPTTSKVVATRRPRKPGQRCMSFDPRPPPRWSPLAWSVHGMVGARHVSIPDHLQGGRHGRACIRRAAQVIGFDPRPPPRWSPPAQHRGPFLERPSFRSPTTSKVVAT